MASNFARALRARLIATNSSTESLPTLEHLPTALDSMYILFSVDTSSKDIQEKHVVDQDTKGGWSQPRLRGVVIMAGWQQPMHT